MCENVPTGRNTQLTRKKLRRGHHLFLKRAAKGNCIVWTLAKQGTGTVAIERKCVGGSYPNIAYLPSQHVIHSAKVAS
jgi:hypothetical protein